jgi:hypothetical protein
MSFQNIWDQDRWKLGKNLGMFNYGQGSKESLAPAVEAATQAQSPGVVSQLNALYSTPGFKELSPDLQSLSALGIFVDSAKPKSEDRRKELRDAFEFNKEQALFAQQLGKESMGIASMYNQLNKLPQTIASAFGSGDDRALMAATYGNIPSIVAQTYNNFPRSQINPVSYSATSTRYFN